MSSIYLVYGALVSYALPLTPGRYAASRPLLSFPRHLSSSSTHLPFPSLILPLYYPAIIHFSTEIFSRLRTPRALRCFLISYFYLQLCASTRFLLPLADLRNRAALVKEIPFSHCRGNRRSHTPVRAGLVESDKSQGESDAQKSNNSFQMRDPIEGMCSACKELGAMDFITMNRMAISRQSIR